MGDDEEVELNSDHVLLSNPNMSRNLQDSEPSMDSFLDDFLKNTRTCTHTHTCNPPGPDAAHSHTCYHTHTQVIASSEEDGKESSSLNKSRIRPVGNREAVRKYREKKKAQTAYLEEEAKKLRLMNQNLVRKLQGQLILEAEVLRLRSALADLRGKIDNEISNTTSGTASGFFKELGDCGAQTVIGRCQTNLPCFHDHNELLSQDNCRIRTNDVEGHSIDTAETLE